MTFLEYIDQSIADMLADIKGQQEAIAALEQARELYREYLEDCAEAKPAEKPVETVPAHEAPKTLPAPIIATPEKFVEPETGRIIGDRRRKEFWTPERKAEASRLAKERWARRQKRPPVEERPRADFRKNVISASPPATEMKDPVRRPAAMVEVKPDIYKMIPEAVRAGLNIVEKGSTEPRPSWSDPDPEKRDIVQMDECPLSIAGSVLINNGKFAAHLDKITKEILQEFIKLFGSTVQRSNIKHIVPNIDQAVLNLKRLIGANVDIVATELGWKMVAAKEEVE